MIKAIETRYKGYRFRSRLEARWAVFFDHLGVRWQYEPEGFDLSKHGLGYYLPDFFLPDLNYWIEVKPASVQDDAAYEKLGWVAAATGADGLVVAGEPYNNVELGGFNMISDPDNLHSKWWIVGTDEDGAGPVDGPYLFCVCPCQRKIGIQFDGRGGRVCGPECRHWSRLAEHLPRLVDDDKAYSGDHPRIVAAAEAARSARFEHGQSGAA